ncbi:MAG: benzoylformate decarboxylase [Chakrabartia sp.]
MTTTVRDATLALLRETGMTTIFGNPGSTELPMFRDFPSDFRYILGLQESVVLGMADGYAQATRNAALVNLHSSAGVGHALGNLFTAYRNQTPLVVTAGQQARSILPYEPFLYAERPSEFPQPFVKWAVEPARAEDVPAAIQRAYHIAMQAPCGPTFVSVPVDDWDRPCAPLAPTRMSREVRGDAALLSELANALAQAKRPALVVGAGVDRDGAWAAAIALAERHKAGVFVAPMAARAGFPEDHPLFQGFLTAGREPIVAALQGHDLILVLGAPAFTYHVEGFGPFVPDGAQLFLIADDPAITSRIPSGTAIVSSLGPALADLLAGPAPAVRPAPAPRAPQPAAPADPLGQIYLMQRLAALRPKGSILVEESPGSRTPMHDHLPILAAETFYTTASGGLGHGLPAAIGIALGKPGQRVICLLGDGSSMYAIQGLWSAAQLGLPISFILVNNGGYDALVQFGRVFDVANPVGTRLAGLDFVAIAQGQGVPGQRVSVGPELDAALNASFSAQGPTLIEVVLG